MPDAQFLDWPFFEDRHRALAKALEPWAQDTQARLSRTVDAHDADALTRAWVQALGDAGWLQHSAIDPDHPEVPLDVRSLCLIRETLARHHGLADFAFAMQGLGTGALSLFGSPFS